MRLNSFILIISTLLILCRCHFSSIDATGESLNIVVKYKTNDCQVGKESVVVVLDNNDCQRCTEKVERLAEILSERISPNQIVFILRNFDPNTIVAYKRSLSCLTDHIFEDEKEVVVHSNLLGMSHFIVFDFDKKKFLAFLPDQFLEMTSLLSD